MLILLSAYLYKYHLKGKLDKLVSFFKKPFSPMVLQPIPVEAAATLNSFK
jgi:hypothetical protein